MPSTSPVAIGDIALGLLSPHADMHTALISRQSVGVSKPRYDILRLVLLQCSYHTPNVKSFPALPIQQSKAVMITLSVVNHASVVSGAPASVRLLADSQSSHAPRLAQDWAIR